MGKNKKKKNPKRSKQISWYNVGKRVLKYFAGIVICFLICWFCVYLYCNNRTSIQSDTSAMDIVGVFKLTRNDNGHCLVNLGKQEMGRPLPIETLFNIDTGSTGNSITQETLNLLQREGYHIEKHFYTAFCRDALGNVQYIDKVYLISFPLDNGITIKDVRFNISDSNILGVEFLKNFYVEICQSKRRVILHHSMPQDYNHKISLDRFNWSFIDMSGRYYWTFPLNGKSHKFFVDTAKGVHGVYALVRDFSGDAPLQYLGTNVHTGTKLWGHIGETEFDTGQYAIFSQVDYSDAYATDYAVNPLHLRDKNGMRPFDILLALNQNAMYLK